MPRQDLPAPGTTDEVVPSAARTASGNSGVLRGWGVASKLRVQLNVTAAGGTSPTLDVVVEDTLDGTNFNTIGTFTQRTAAGRQVIDITGLFTDQLQVRWTVGGTSPSFTFTVNVYSE